MERHGDETSIEGGQGEDGSKTQMCPTHENQMVDSITCDKFEPWIFHGHMHGVMIDQ